MKNVKEDLVGYLADNVDLLYLYTSVETALKESVGIEDDELEHLTLIITIIQLHKAMKQIGTMTVEYSKEKEEEFNRERGRIKQYLDSISDN